MMIVLSFFVFVFLLGLAGFLSIGSAAGGAWFGSVDTALAFFSSLGFCGYAMAVLYLSIAVRHFSWVGVFNLFSLGVVLVHFYFPFMQFFFPEVWDLPRMWRNPEIVVKASAVALCSYSAFCFSYIVSTKLKETKRRQTVPARLLKLSKIVPIALVCFAYLFFIAVLVIDPGHYLDGAYGYERREGGGGVVGYLLLAFRAFFFCALAIELYRVRRDNPQTRPIRVLLGVSWPLIIGTAFFIGLSLFVGDRGPIIQTAFLLGGGYAYFFGKIRFPVFLLMITLGVLAMGFLRYYRTYEKGVSIEEKIEEGSAGIAEVQWYMIPGELGGSVEVWHAAIKLVDEVGLSNGWFLFNNTLSLIPFGASAMRSVSGNPMVGVTSSTLMTEVVRGPDAVAGTGITVLSDLYLDFGLTGAVMGMMVLGVLFSRFEKSALATPRLSSHVLLVLLCGFALYWGRSTYLPAKEIVWAVFLSWVIETTLRVANITSGEMSNELRKSA